MPLYEPDQVTKKEGCWCKRQGEIVCHICAVQKKEEEKSDDTMWHWGRKWYKIVAGEYDFWMKWLNEAIDTNNLKLAVKREVRAKHLLQFSFKMLL